MPLGTRKVRKIPKCGGGRKESTQTCTLKHAETRATIQKRRDDHVIIKEN
jgi:hypothetical protein